MIKNFIYGVLTLSLVCLYCLHKATGFLNPDEPKIKTTKIKKQSTPILRHP